MIFLYDNEEVGSLSFQGAQSRFTESVFRRLCEAFLTEHEQKRGQDIFEVTVANSFHISMDAAHYVHPNYPEKHEDNLKPKMYKGCTTSFWH